MVLTASELKKYLDLTISNSPSSGVDIYLSQAQFIKAKYSCTEDDKDFTMYKGKVYYKGYRLITKQW